MSASATQVRLGIDFGTSNTVSMLERPGLPATPLLFDGSPVLPSAVFAGEDKLLVGRDAERAAMSAPANFEPHPKRCIADGKVLLGPHEFDAVDLVAALLSRVAGEAHRVAGFVPGTVVLTHPAGWEADRLQLLGDAALKAGLPQPRFVAEPVAAATHFSAHLGHTFPDGGHIVVYDLGGGTFDVSVVRMLGDDIEVTATGGLNSVGGIDIDFAVVDHLAATYSKATQQWQRLLSPTTPLDRRHRRSLWRDVRDAKELLSRESSAALFIPLMDVDAHLTRDELNELAGPLLRQTVALTLDVMARAQVELDQVAGMFLVGGASRMPLASTLLMRQTYIAPTVLEQPELVVASGAIDAPGQWAPHRDVPHDHQTTRAPGGPLRAPVVPRQIYRGVAKVSAFVPPGEGETAIVPTQPTTPTGETVDSGPEITSESAQGPIVGLAYSAHGLLAVARTNSVTISEPGGPAVIACDYDEPVAALEWSGEDPALLAVATGERVALWRKTDNDLESVRQITCPRDIGLLSWSRHGLAAADDSCIHVWDNETGELVQSLPFGSANRGARLRTVAWSPDGTRLAAGGALGTIKLWTYPDVDPSIVLSNSPVGVRSLEWSPDGDWLVSGDAAGSLRIWRLSDSTSQEIDKAHDAAVQALAWSPDGKLLASGSIDSQIRLWDAGSGRDLGYLSGHRGFVSWLCWTAEGDLMSAGADGTIRQWDTTAGTEISPAVTAKSAT